MRKPKNKFSLEHLQYLHTVLVKNPTINAKNQNLIVETLRQIAELVIWGDQHNEQFFDFFLEKNILSFFLAILKQDCSVAVKVQLIQTLSILVENLRSEIALFYLLSNNHINELIQHRFDFSDEELVAYYISFVKTLSLKLNPKTIQFFFNEQDGDFPLYTEAIKFFNSKESMIRVAVRTLTLNVLKVEDNATRKFIIEKTAAPYCSNLVWYLADQSHYLDQFVPGVSHSNAGRLGDLSDEILDQYYYLNDLLALHGIGGFNLILLYHMVDHYINPVLIRALLAKEVKQIQGASQTVETRPDQTNSTTANANTNSSIEQEVNGNEQINNDVKDQKDGTKTDDANTAIKQNISSGSTENTSSNISSPKTPRLASGSNPENSGNISSPKTGRLSNILSSAPFLSPYSPSSATVKGNEVGEGNTASPSAVANVAANPLANVASTNSGAINGAGSQTETTSLSTSLFLLGEIIHIFNDSLLINCLGALLVHPNPLPYLSDRNLLFSDKLPKLMSVRRQRPVFGRPGYAALRAQDLSAAMDTLRSKLGATSPTAVPNSGTTLANSSSNSSGNVSLSLRASSPPAISPKKKGMESIYGRMERPDSNLRTSIELTRTSTESSDNNSNHSDNEEEENDNEDENNREDLKLLAYREKMLDHLMNNKDDRVTLGILCVLYALLKNTVTDRKLLQAADLFPIRMTKAKLLLGDLLGSPSNASEHENNKKDNEKSLAETNNILNISTHSLFPSTTSTTKDSIFGDDDDEEDAFGSVLSSSAKQRSLVSPIAADSSASSVAAPPSSDVASKSSSGHAGAIDAKDDDMTRSMKAAGLCEDFVNAIVFVLKDFHQHRIITLQMAILLLKELTFTDDYNSNLVEKYQSIVLEIYEMAKNDLRQKMINSLMGDVFLELFEDELRSFKQLNFDNLVTDATLLLPVAKGPTPGVDFSKRMPSGEVEEVKKSIRHFLLYRELYYTLLNKKDDLLPLKETHQSAISNMKPGNIIDTEDKTKLLCHVQGKPTAKRALIVEGRFLLITEPVERGTFSPLELPNPADGDVFAAMDKIIPDYKGTYESMTKDGPGNASPGTTPPSSPAGQAATSTTPPGPSQTTPSPQSSPGFANKTAQSPPISPRQSSAGASAEDSEPVPRTPREKFMICDMLALQNVEAAINRGDPNLLLMKTGGLVFSDSDQCIRAKLFIDAAKHKVRQNKIGQLCILLGLDPTDIQQKISKRFSNMEQKPGNFAGDGGGVPSKLRNASLSFDGGPDKETQIEQAVENWMQSKQDPSLPSDRVLDL